MRWTRCSIVGANRGCARLLGRRCAPGGRVRGQCCTALMDTRRGPCRPFAFPVLPLGLPRRTRGLVSTWRTAYADLLEFLPASSVAFQACSMQRILSVFFRAIGHAELHSSGRRQRDPSQPADEDVGFRGLWECRNPELAEGRRQSQAPSVREILLTCPFQKLARQWSLCSAFRSYPPIEYVMILSLFCNYQMI